MAIKDKRTTEANSLDVWNFEDRGTWQIHQFPTGVHCH